MYSRGSASSHSWEPTSALAGVVAGGEYQPVVADGPSDLLLLAAGNRVGPQVFHPDAFLGGLRYVFAQLVAIGADHVLDVRPYQVGEHRMRQVDVVRADEEQVELPVHALRAVVVGDGGLQPLRIVAGYGLADILLGGGLHVFQQDGMGGPERQAVALNDEGPLQLGQPGDGVDALDFVPSALFRRQFRGLANQRLVESADGRPQQRPLQRGGQHVEAVLGHEEEGPPARHARRVVVMPGGGVQAVRVVEVQGLLHVGPGQVVVGGLGFRFRRRGRRRVRGPGGRGFGGPGGCRLRRTGSRGLGGRRGRGFRRRGGRRLRRNGGVGASVAVGSPPQATAKTAKEARTKNRNNAPKPAGVLRLARPVSFPPGLPSRLVRIAIHIRSGYMPPEILS